MNPTEVPRAAPEDFFQQPLPTYMLPAELCLSPSDPLDAPTGGCLYPNTLLSINVQPPPQYSSLPSAFTKLNASTSTDSLHYPHSPSAFLVQAIMQEKGLKQIWNHSNEPKQRIITYFKNEILSTKQFVTDTYKSLLSVQLLRVMSDSLSPHGLQHARPPCP